MPGRSFLEIAMEALEGITLLRDEAKITKVMYIVNGSWTVTTSLLAQLRVAGLVEESDGIFSVTSRGRQLLNQYNIFEQAGLVKPNKILLIRRESAGAVMS